MRRKLLIMGLLALLVLAAALLLPTVIHEEPAPPESVAEPARRTSRAGGTSSSPSRPRKPRAKACLTPGSGAADGGDELGAARVGEGLSRSQLDAAFRPHLDYLNGCRPDDGEDHSGHVTFEIEVGCNGLVAGVEVADDSLYEPAMIECLRDRLTYVGFPAHDRAEGVLFEYPLIFHR
jgi:hypothetical protein